MVATHELARSRHVRWQAIPIFVAFLIPLLLVACLGKDPTAGLVLGSNAQLAAGPAVVTCSADCRDTSQCGAVEDGTQVVLMNTFTPATETHNMAIPVDTQVQIIDSRGEPMRRMSTNDQFTLNYYSVIVEGREDAGWIAGWCLMGTPGQ